MNAFMNDFRYAFRQLRKAPGFSLAAVLTLALGIGSSSTIFCAIDAFWLHPLNVPHPGNIVRIFATTQQDPQDLFTYRDYEALSKRVTALQGPSAGIVSLAGRGSMMPRSDGTALMLLTNVVSSNFFEVMGVRPLVGRLFTTEDAQQSRTHPMVVLGYSCWKREFGGNSNIVGQSITLMRGKDRRFQVAVLGVLPPQFRDIDPQDDRDIWMPTNSWAAIGNANELTTQRFRWLNILGRLAPGATIAQVNEEVASVASALAVADPVDHRGYGARAISDFNFRMGRAGTAGMVLFAIVGGVVLLAIVNVAHLMLARGLARTPEVALRLSLGGRRWRVARQLLIENLVLVLSGSCLGLIVAMGLSALLPKILVLAPATLRDYGMGPQFQMDARVLLFAALLSLATMLLLALVPLSQVARTQLLPVLRSQATSHTGSRTPALRRVAVWLQIGISFALLVVMGALVRSFLNTRTKPLGMTRDQVLVMFTQDPDVEVRNTVLRDLQALPGVRQTAYAMRSPLMPSEGGTSTKILLPGDPGMREPVEVKYNAVSDNYLSVVGTTIVRGHGFSGVDDRNAAPEVVVSEAMAHRFWADRDPLGQIVRLTRFTQGADLDARVVGVATDTPINAIGELPESYMYIPFRFRSNGTVTLVVQTAQNAMALAPVARQVLIHVNPLLDPMFVSSLPELIRYSAADYQTMAELVSALGVIGILLTVIGLNGFLVFSVTQRRREIGIRMALGATRESTARLVLRDTAAIAATGLGVGVVLALIAGRLVAAVLFGVRPLDFLTCTGSLAIMAAAVSLAAWLPARRAASIEPMEALRTE
jgi:predicted permease